MPRAIEDEAQALERAVLQLPPAQREIVLLRFVEKRGMAEVARLTGRTEAAVRSLQHHALVALARLLGRPDDQGTA